MVESERCHVTSSVHVPVCLFQKWQCVEDATGKLRLFKCKNEGGGAKNIQRGVVSRQRPISIKSQLYHQQLDGCDCNLRDLLPFNLRPTVMRPFNKKPFFSKKSECSRSPAGGSSEPTSHLSGSTFLVFIRKVPVWFATSVFSTSVT